MSYNYFPSREEIDSVRGKYPNGSRVRLVSMSDPHAPPAGTEGTVISVDAIGTIHVKWDTGHMLGVAYGEDLCELVS
jgi:hypothetical protein